MKKYKQLKTAKKLSVILDVAYALGLDISTYHHNGKYYDLDCSQKENNPREPYIRVCANFLEYDNRKLDTTGWHMGTTPMELFVNSSYYMSMPIEDLDAITFEAGFKVADNGDYHQSVAYMCPNSLNTDYNDINEVIALLKKWQSIIRYDFKGKLLDAATPGLNIDFK